MPLKNKLTDMRVEKAWAHMQMVTYKPFRIYLKREEAVCTHGKDFGFKCIIPVTILIPKTKKEL